jgi:hypothetical protein
MRFVKRNTLIPVPTVYCAFTHKERTYTMTEESMNIWQQRDGVRQLEDNVDGGPIYVPPLRL